MTTSVPLIFAATSDLAGKVRGKAFPADQLEKRLMRGVGWTPTNVQINCFDGIADSPFGALGDLLLIPDANAEVNVRFNDDHRTHFMLGDIVKLNGEPWEFCTRALLRAALERLKQVAGVHLLAAFEHEFQLKRDNTTPNQAYALYGYEQQQPLCETLMGALKTVGLSPDSIMKEYGPDQYEVVIGPEHGIRAADAAVMVRELTRSSAKAHGEEATYSPIRDINSVGNGVHVHMSLLDENGEPASYDAKGVCGMSELAGAFAAGILKYIDVILALTAPSVVSYERLTPHRWSAAYNNLGFRDREASLRVCPVTAKDPTAIARQFNLEYRAADAASSPYLALAAIVHAGVQGIEEGLQSPQATEEDLSLLTNEELETRGFIRLPQTLDAALECLAQSETARQWFPSEFIPVYRAHKLSEIEHLAHMDTQSKCIAYENTY